jgi:hypothetical protein
MTGIIHEASSSKMWTKTEKIKFMKVLVLAPNYKQHILSQDKLINLLSLTWTLCQMCLFEFIRVEGGVKSLKHFREGRNYESLETSALNFTFKDF